MVYGKSLLSDLDSICCYFEDCVRAYKQSAQLPANCYNIHPPPGYLNAPECPFILTEHVSVKGPDGLWPRRLFVNPLAPDKAYVPAVEAIRAMGLDTDDTCDQAIASLWMEVNRTSRKIGLVSLPPFPMKAFCMGNGKGEIWEGLVLSLTDMNILLKTVRGRAYFGLSLFVSGLQPRVLVPQTM